MELSIGDYILVGGEIASQVVVEGCIRLLPGVLGQPESLLEESFSSNLLEYPQYTRPKIWKDAYNKKHNVPEILLSGSTNGEIKIWEMGIIAIIVMMIIAIISIVVIIIMIIMEYARQKKERK